MEVKIGIQNVAREVILETNSTTEAVLDSLTTAFDQGGVWQLKDDKGRLVIVPVSQIGYVELGAETLRRVGFGSV